MSLPTGDVQRLQKQSVIRRRMAVAGSSHQPLLRARRTAALGLVGLNAQLIPYASAQPHSLYGRPDINLDTSKNEPGEMCLITPSSSRRGGAAVIIDRDDYLAPRPVSNFHGGPARRSAERTTYYRRTSTSIPRERVSYRYRRDEPRYSTELCERHGGAIQTAQERDVDVTAAALILGFAQPTVTTENIVTTDIFFCCLATETDYLNIGRSHSIRSKKSDGDKSLLPKHRFAMASLRGMQQPELSKKLYKLIKTENHLISAHEAASREGQSVANQLSEWGESTEDESVSDISDKLGVLLSEIAEQEDLFSQNLEESRGILKQIRNTESSVQPSRNHKAKIQDEIQKLKYKEPESTKLVTLEQELVRAEAQSLVAEAQLTNVTRQKFKEAFDVHTAAVIERAQKQILLATHARTLLSLLDDTPIIPGEERPAFANYEAARDVLNDAEASLRGWSHAIEPIPSTAGRIGANAMPEPNVGGELPIRAAEEKLAAEGSLPHAAAGTTVERETEVVGGSEPPYPTTETTGGVVAS